MIEEDTVKLLRECDAGVKMGVSSINDVLDSVEAEELRRRLVNCRAAHEELGREIRGRLDRFQDRGKDPSPIAQGMSWVKSNVMLAMKNADSTIADLMTDGCNMGVKSLNRYLNQYAAAEEYSKDVAKRLIGLEQKLTADVRDFL